ncbi:Uncharacterised protein [Vibrio cholerae]|nr:Uncharacterised protein [Vibrio cholerae]CSB22606.1 Uncharacterised protein [Vibrio cholerae]CSC77592.1 Uncharacterised protein [Vibrio cholerae]CSD11410.1 Uncharacterised protein [Vibrio cholerae]
MAPLPPPDEPNTLDKASELRVLKLSKQTEKMALNSW